MVEHDVVVGPDLSDEEEGDGVGEIGRPERAEAVQQVRGIGRWSDLENEQGDGDREDGIGKRDQPCRTAKPSSRATRSTASSCSIPTPAIRARKSVKFRRLNRAAFVVLLHFRNPV